MPLSRRGFLKTCLILAAAPAIVKAENIMPITPVKQIVEIEAFPLFLCSARKGQGFLFDYESDLANNWSEHYDYIKVAETPKIVNAGWTRDEMAAISSEMKKYNFYCYYSDGSIKPYKYSQEK